VVQRAGASERARIVDVAAAQFVEHGYAATSLATVAEAADVDVGRVRRLFGTKSAVLDAVVDPLVDDLDRVLPTGPAAGDVDRIALLRAYLFAVLRSRPAAHLVLFDRSARGTHAVEVAAERMRRVVALLVGPRANLERQVRVRCALAVCQLAAGELSGVPPHRLRQPLLESAIDTMVGPDPRGARVTPSGQVALDLRPRRRTQVASSATGHRT
jgi:AcrR family transcriptional regulator